MSEAWSATAWIAAAGDPAEREAREEFVFVNNYLLPEQKVALAAVFEEQWRQHPGGVGSVSFSRPPVDPEPVNDLHLDQTFDHATRRWTLTCPVCGKNAEAGGLGPLEVGAGVLRNHDRLCVRSTYTEEEPGSRVQAWGIHRAPVPEPEVEFTPCSVCMGTPGVVWVDGRGAIKCPRCGGTGGV